ncbi:hypothetical protein [Occallatibacter savannae]|uniref:hypothetical protein n=1 Tax=Occallatibacter savannae TaxID=1002691 RepID=UPI000D697C8B|nr:hypothetical protein [Occallatibacter savannae]
MPRKTGCQYPLVDDNRRLIMAMQKPLAAPLSHPFEIDDQHPSLYAAIEDLMIYERWVSEVVLRIAFRWIDENKEKVYPAVPKGLEDDIGVVINAAYKAVMKETLILGDDVTTRPLNPTWVKIIEGLQKARCEVFAKKGQLLEETACIPTEEQVPA